jgi:type IV secretion system protein VirB9
MTARLIRTICATLAAAAALAQLAPAPALAQDSRLVELLYEPDRVVRIEGRPRVQATIQFADDERIENVAIGDSNAWQVTPNKRANLLFVKPLASRAITNMTVVTNERTYLFDLVASPQNRPVYIVKFTYPEPIEPEDLMIPDLPSEAELAAANDPFSVIDPAALNFAWDREGNRRLLPEQVYDDGEATYLVWPGAEEVPAILVVDAEGLEGPVNYTVRGDTIIIPHLPGRIVLRAGRNAAELTYRGPAVADMSLAHNERDGQRRR